MIRMGSVGAHWRLGMAWVALTGFEPGAVKPANPPSQWWRSAVCYEVFVRSFADSDGDGVGDLKGLISRLDYINDGNPASAKSLGANCIWLMPIAKAVSYHGYDVTDYYHVDPRYGTDEDFHRLIRAAHARGIHVIVDFVPNHTSSEHPFFQSALHDTASAYRSWYRWSLTRPAQPAGWNQELWHKSPVRDEYYYGFFWGGMPDLNYATPAVMAEMQRVTDYWLRTMGVDGFRFDAIPYLVEEGDQIEHTRGTHEILRRFGSAIRAASPRSFTIGEVSNGSQKVLATYYPDQLDAYFAFGVAAATMESARTGNSRSFVNAVKEATASFPEGRWAPFLTNHDQPRVMTVMQGDARKSRVAASAMLMLPGLPFVYYGEEIGMIGAKPDETIRTPMQWSGGKNGGFTAGTPWESLQSDWRQKNVAAESADPGSLLNYYRRLIHFRNAHQALSRGGLRMAATDEPHTAAFVRSEAGENILVVVNFGDAAVDQMTISLPDPVREKHPALYPVREKRPALDLLIEDPRNGCRSGEIADDGSTVKLDSIAAYGFCAFRLRN